MKNKVSVVHISERAEFNELMKLYNDPKINETFDGYRTDRLIASEISFLIYLGNKPIGFILLVREREQRDSLGIDVALKKEYRGKGYGRIAMEIFRDNFVDRINADMHIQVSEKNVAANRIVSLLDSEYVGSIDGSDYYKVIKGRK